MKETANVLTAPWSDEQVEALNEYQRGGWSHPFTCGRCRDADPDFPLRDQHLLVATVDGWTCPTCDYTQDWAHEGMFHGPPGWWLTHFATPDDNGSTPEQGT